LLPHFSKLLLAALCCGTLLAACSSQGTRPPRDSEAALPGDYARALELMGRDDYAAAIPVLQNFIQQHPEHAGPYLNLGIAYRHGGDRAAAQQALNRSLELNPSAAVYNQLGMLYREQGEFESALTAYRTALQLNPDYSLAHRNLGILYDLYLQQPVLALDHYRRFIELDGSSDPDVDRWVVDLQRRTDSAQASVSP
jgi:tetratricopeptide (TPR) repeat protein